MAPEKIKTFKPMLAKGFQEHKHKLTYPVLVSNKCDGICAIFRKHIDGDEGEDDGQYHFYSRANKRWRDNVVAHILEPLREAVGEQNVTLCGEFYHHGFEINDITSAITVRKKEPNDNTRLIEFNVFDMVSDGPWVERIVGAAVLIAKVDTAKTVDMAYAANEAVVMEYHKSWVAAGYEGTIVRATDAPYIHKRTDQVLKLKEYVDSEFKIVDFIEGKDTDKGGKHLGRLGAFIMETTGGERFKCSGQLSDEFRQYVWDNRSDYLGKMATVKYMRLYSSGIPREPIFLAIRDYE